MSIMKMVIETGGPLKKDKLMWVLDQSSPPPFLQYLLVESQFLCTCPFRVFVCTKFSVFIHGHVYHG